MSGVGIRAGRRAVPSQGGYLPPVSPCETPPEDIFEQMKGRGGGPC